MNIRLILFFLSFCACIEELRRRGIIRKDWRWSTPQITNIYEYIGYNDDFQALTRMHMDTFLYIAGKMKPYLKWPRDWYLKIDINSTNYPFKKQECVLSQMID